MSWDQETIPEACHHWAWSSLSNSVRFLLVAQDVLEKEQAKKQAFIGIRLRPTIVTSFIAVAARVSLHLSVSCPLRPNVTSSIKPEVHNVAQRCQRRTKPWLQRSAYEIWWGLVQRFQRYAHGQTDRDTQTHRQTGYPYRGGVITLSEMLQ